MVDADFNDAAYSAAAKPTAATATTKASVTTAAAPIPCPTPAAATRTTAPTATTPATVATTSTVSQLANGGCLVVTNRPSERASVGEYATVHARYIPLRGV